MKILENDKQNKGTERIVNNTKYIVKSVFVGDRDIKDILINLAERKAIKEMDL